jgi:hypothetical protein
VRCEADADVQRAASEQRERVDASAHLLDRRARGPRSVGVASRSGDERSPGREGDAGGAETREGLRNVRKA